MMNQGGRNFRICFRIERCDGYRPKFWRFLGNTSRRGDSTIQFIHSCLLCDVSGPLPDIFIYWRYKIYSCETNHTADITRHGIINHASFFEFFYQYTRITSYNITNLFLITKHLWLFAGLSWAFWALFSILLDKVKSKAIPVKGRGGL
jgi:hypothetical protein